MAEILTPSLIRAARALLHMDQAGLAASSGISRKTISLIETDDTPPDHPKKAPRRAMRRGVHVRQPALRRGGSVEEGLQAEAQAQAAVLTSGIAQAAAVAFGPMTTTVMLSFPPASFAAVARCSAGLVACSARRVPIRFP